MDYILVAYAFREELEKQKGLDQLPDHLKKFPCGCCGVVSELLGDYFNTQLGLRVEYVCGEKDGGSHAWIESTIQVPGHIAKSAKCFERCSVVPGFPIQTYKKSHP
ncbi:hypothetical protein MNU22_02750 [Pseudomonas aeruginosa]|nr:hypothetical protein [Pseudomonas aeruginosa]